MGSCQSVTHLPAGRAHSPRAPAWSRTGKGGYEGAFSFKSRFEEGEGTNPEELIGAAHAGCFSMAFSKLLAEAGHPPTSVET